MPRTIRDDTKRKIDRAIGNLDWSGKHLAEIIITYQEQHPEIAEPLRDAATVIAELQDLIRKVGRQI
jgi:hypothetical protein